MPRTAARKTASSVTKVGRALIWGSAAAVILGASGAADAQMWLKLTNIEGESASPDHPREIDILGFDLPLVAPAPTGGGGGSGKVACPAMTLFKNTDKATPLLMKALVGSRHIAEGVLAVRKSGEGQKDYYIVTMTEIVVSEVAQTSTTDNRIADRIALTARMYTFEYKPQDDKGGTLPSIKFSWDCVAQTVA
jgi:type VI secretion system secreted protein Hcp